jgi:hypothetical protein
VDTLLKEGSWITMESEREREREQNMLLVETLERGHSKVRHCE